MSPKEKAAELIKTFTCYRHVNNRGVWETEIDHPAIKKYALAAVRETQQALIEYGNENHELQNMDRTLDWWNKVETEIENLP